LAVSHPQHLMYWTWCFQMKEFHSSIITTTMNHHRKQEKN